MSDVKVTNEEVQEIVKETRFIVATVGDKTTIVHATLPNGFVIVESSSCVDPANYDEKMGFEICKDRIVNKIWEMEGYKLQGKVAAKSCLTEQQNEIYDRIVDEQEVEETFTIIKCPKGMMPEVSCEICGFSGECPIGEAVLTQAPTLPCEECCKDISNTDLDDRLACLMGEMSFREQRVEGDSPEMTFGYAIESLKCGFKVARKGWNGHGMYLQAQFPDEHSKMTHPYLVITVPGCSEGTRLVPWQPAQVDLFAEDWAIVE